MSHHYIPAALRRQVARRAAYRCEYCQTQESTIGMALEVEHIIPQAAGGNSEESNLGLACPKCNRFKGTRLQAVPLTRKRGKKCRCFIRARTNGLIILPGSKAAFIWWG